MLKEMVQTLRKINQIKHFSTLRYHGQEQLISKTKKNVQIEYVRSLTQEDVQDWGKVKDFILKNGENVYSSINKKNINNVMIKTLLSSDKMDIALSFAEYINANEKELSLGSINGLLAFYCHLQKTRDLTDSEKMFILNTYEALYRKYKSLDYSTCENLIQALCAIDDWEKSLSVLEDLKQTATPSHSAYSNIIATQFKNNQRSKALKLIEESLNNRRVLHHRAYKEWIEFVLRECKDEKTVMKQINDIMNQIKDSFTIVAPETGKLLLNAFSKLGWKGAFIKIRKSDGHCFHCAQNLDSLSATNVEFKHLQRNIRDRIIIGSDLFLKSNPEELKRFIKYVEENGPFDIVIDALNVALGVQGKFQSRMRILDHVVNHFTDQKKKVLILGRKHMLKWSKTDLNSILRKTYSFFTEDLSQDDPYLITAAILSGPHTDVVSKDLFRGHLYNLKEERLRNIFKRWQWQHQWMVFTSGRQINIQEPLKFTPCTQFKNNTWHLPIEIDRELSFGHVNDGIPNLNSWLCLYKS